jgi:hypothetical protein
MGTCESSTNFEQDKMKGEMNREMNKGYYIPNSVWRNKFDFALNNLLKENGLERAEQVTYNMFYETFHSFPVEDICIVAELAPSNNIIQVAGQIGDYWFNTQTRNGFFDCVLFRQNSLSPFTIKNNLYEFGYNGSVRVNKKFESKQLKKKEAYWVLKTSQTFNKTLTLVSLDKYM